MGLVDAFSEEERFNIKYSELYALTKEAAKGELLYNAVKCRVPHNYIMAMFDGVLPEVKKISAG